MSIDIVTAEVVRNGINGAVREMFSTIIRAAHSPLLYANHDFAVGIVSADARLWGSAPGCATFVTLLPKIVGDGLARRPVESLRDGDCFVVNDPFLTGTHISDTTIYSPIFVEGRLIAFSAVTAHWIDIGGKVPGGWCPDSTDVYQEGICFTHEQLAHEWRKDEQLFTFITQNVRYPRPLLGDIQSQISACRQGSDRIKRLCAKYGPDTVVAAMDDVIDRTTAMMKRRIGRLPDGVYAADSAIDGDGIDPELHCVIALQVTISDDRLTVTFDGSGPTTAGPVNHPGAIADVYCALKGLLAPNEDPNEGHSAAFDHVPAPGTVVGPLRPAPTDSYGYVGVVLIELAIAALSDALPGLTPAAGYQLFGGKLSLTTPDPDASFVFDDVSAGGAGARPSHDGPTLVFAGNGDTPTISVEVLETRFPIRCREHSLIFDHAGHGQYRGGPGIRRDFEVLVDGVAAETSIQNSETLLAVGVRGGSDGAASYAVLNPDTPEEQVFRRQGQAAVMLKSGDVMSYRAGGGGGYGRPGDRDRSLVEQDIVEEKVTEDTAAEIYAYRRVGVRGGT